MYGIVAPSEGGMYLEAGIHENVTLQKIEFGPAKEGGNINALKFVFANEAGELFEHMEFAINEQMHRDGGPRWGKTVDQLIENDYQNLGARIYHIASCFVSEQELTAFAQSFTATPIQANSPANAWKEYCKRVFQLFHNPPAQPGTPPTGKFLNVPLRIKVVYNKKGYTRFPGFVTKTNGFCERMDASPSTVHVTAKDKMRKPEPVANPDATSAAGGGWGAPAAEPAATQEPSANGQASGWGNDTGFQTFPAEQPGF